MQRHKFCTALAALDSTIVITSSWAFPLDCFFNTFVYPQEHHMKSRCFHRTESCLSRFLSPSCFCHMRAKLCLLYLSRTLVKSFGSPYLECKKKPYNFYCDKDCRPRQISIKMLICICLCSSSVLVKCPDISVYSPGHCGSYFRGWTVLIFYSSTTTLVGTTCRKKYCLIQNACWQLQMDAKDKKLQQKHQLEGL